MFQRRWHWIVTIVVVAALGAAWIAYARVPSASAAVNVRESPRVGFNAPRLRTNLLTGDQLDLEQLRGKVVVLNFWATWCAPCRAEMPALQKLYDARQRDGLVVLGVNQLEDPDTITAFMREFQLSFPVALDPAGEWNRRYQIRGLPTTFFVNRQGVIRDVVFGGPMDSALLESKIDALLREP